MEAYLQTFLQKFQHLKIQLEDIKEATNDFNNEKNRIGRGGFGNVYKGELSHFEGRSMVAIKRLNLDPRNLQGTPEFLKEITMLSDYKHENVISLLGFCCEGSEMILVYEHASHGSLDRYLNSPHLTWSQRIKICLDAAKGLNHLHDPRETHRRLIHCDVKSANILLDEQWNAKVSDLGLSIIGSANEQHSLIVTLAAGTEGYIDPQYQMTNTLTKESDVYSFGVVLLEVLCGRLCYTYSNGRVQLNLVPRWIESYEQNQLNDIIFKNPAIQPIDQGSLDRFSNIAYRCLEKSRQNRPTMAEVVNELKRAHELIKNQELMLEWVKLKSGEPPVSNRSEVELTKLLSKGVLLNDGKTWFSLNKKGEHCEMISIAECLGSEVLSSRFSSKYNSRFTVSTTYSYLYADEILKTHVRTQFLSPGNTYTVNLVFKFQDPFMDRRCTYIGLKYKLEGETESSISQIAYKREDGWWMCELYQFPCDHRIVHLHILFEGFDKRDYSDILVEGIEFQPLENVENTDENVDWEEKLPVDYEDIMNRSKNSLQWTTKEEAYSIIRKGFLINNDVDMKRGIWFSLDNNGKKCHMLSAKAAGIWGSYNEIMFLPESRFGEVIRYDCMAILIGISRSDLEKSHLSSETIYEVYLVYKLPKDQSGFKAPVKVYCSQDIVWYIYLVSPQTPFIRPKVDPITHTPLSRPKIKGVPQLRNDGWMEVQIWELQPHNYGMDLALVGLEFSGLIIEGIEFRPI